MTRTHLIFLAGLGSFILLAGAFVFQAIGYAPCKMCFWQRYPHAVAIGISLLCLWRPKSWLIALGGISAATTAAVGAFHSGVEQKWWDGPSSCSGGTSLGGLNGNDLLSTDVVDKVVMCDEISWAFVGLSMPSWNAVLSFVLVVIWIMSWKKS